ncbi:MAG: DNA mismatch repair endonuclease MutL [Clostridia bacterium]|nr:DNA mismatch repair endonuclease MutL [Clostridia bacterium]
MPRINVLPKAVAELIAAGEVVERPASVVKELVENAIDAKATAVSVEIKNGGIKYIRVTDNGCGILREDVKTAFISHATSKIQSADDLNSIFTLGFRGEALPSVAAVSRLSVLTKTAEEEIGTSFVIEGGQAGDTEDAGCPDGTTIIVRDLFFNTPARMKFLKRDITEGGYVADIITKTALSHPEIKFSFIKDGKPILSTPGNGELLSTIYALFGKDIADALIECTYELDGIKVNGYISRPLNNRPNRNMQFFFVNGRFVRIPAAVPALDEAYKNRIMVGKFPMCFLFTEIQPEKIDVNVHPAKTEIRFSDERKIFELFYYAAKGALNMGDNKRPDVKLKAERDILRKPQEEVRQLEIKAEPVKPQVKPQTMLRDTTSVFENFINKSEEPSVEAKNKVIATQRPFAEFDRQQREKQQADISVVFEEKNITSPKEDRLSFVEDIKNEEKPQINTQINTQTVQKEEIPEKVIPHFNVIGEIFKTYILVECGDKMLIIDKHAAHERMIFNEISKAKGNVNSQLLLSPVAVTLSGREHSAVIDNLDIFSQCGYLVEDFGASSVIVRECPVELGREDISSLITEMAGQLLKGNMNPVPEKLDWLYHSTACRAAVKAGDKTNILEMTSFVKRILEDDEIRYCPHGRPVVYELSRREIEKQFGRLG